MPHFIPGVDIRDSGTPKGRAQIIDFDSNLTAAVTDGIADVDASGGGGGSSIEAKLDGSTLTATAASFDATEGLFASAVTDAITYSVYGAVAGVLASRPAAARANKRGLYYATDTKTAYSSDGSSWTTLFTLGTISSQDASNVSITGGSITGITDLAVADGGTGASSASAARTNLGLVIGTDVEAWNADLDDLVTQWQRATSASQANLHFHEDSDNGTNRINLTAPAAITNNVDLFLPDTLTDDTIASLALAQTLTNKTVALGSNTVSGTLAQFNTAVTDDNLLGAANNLSDVVSAGTARTNLGLVIGTDVEAHDTDLTTIAGLTPTNDDIIQRKAGAWTNRTIAQLVTDLNLGAVYQPLDSDLTAIAALTATTDNFIVSVSSAWASRTPSQVRTTLGLVIGTNVQAWDADLDALAGLTSAADKLPYFTGSNTAAVTDFSSFARTLVDDTTAAAMRTTLGLVIGTDVSALTEIQVYTSSGSSPWSKPTGAKAVLVIGVGGGGGGGSGRVAATGAIHGGGGGGGAGGTSIAYFNASDLGSTENFAIGAGGAGNAGKTGTNDGAQGTIGGDTTFGTTIRVKAGGGDGGGGGTNAAGGAPGAGTTKTTEGLVPTVGGNFGGSYGPTFSGPPGGIGGNGTTYTVGAGGKTGLVGYSAGGGGGGGGMTSGGGAGGRQAGDDGGAGMQGTVAGGTGGAVASNGNAGSNSAVSGPGGGGGGGGAATSGTAGAGGNGGTYGGGGGGGGAMDATGGTSGTGGTGGAGVLIVVTFK